MKRSQSTPLDSQRLLRLHIRALFRLDDDDRLVSANDADGGAAPRFFIGRTAEGVGCWFRRDLEPSLADELAALAASLPPTLPAGDDPAITAAVGALLERSEPVTKVWGGPAFVVPEARPADEARAVPITAANADLLEPHFRDWLVDVEGGPPFTAILEDGHAVSICCSVRVTPEAHEAGVETAPPFRGRGHAGHAVGAWGALVRARGCVPLYSTSWENRASRAVARKAGLIQYGATLHLR